MRSTRFTAGLGLMLVLLGAAVPSMGQQNGGMAQTTQPQKSDIDQAIAEDNRLFQEGSAASMGQALVPFERDTRLSRDRFVPRLRVAQQFLRAC